MIRFLLLHFHQGNTEKPGKILMVVIKIALDSLRACKAPSIIDVDYKDEGIQKTGPPRQPRMPRIGPCQVLAATLTLSQPGGGADYAQPILGSLAG